MSHCTCIHPMECNILLSVLIVAEAHLVETNVENKCFGRLACMLRRCREVAMETAIQPLTELHKWCDWLS